MRISTIITIGITLLISCTYKADYNIVTADVDIDTLEVRLMYDSFETKIKENLLTKVDTSDIWKSLESLTDSSIMKDWNKESLNLGMEYFDKTIKELNKPNIVKNKEEDAIHFALLSKDYLELEISKERILYSRNKEEIKSKNIDKRLWGQIIKKCKCETNDNLNSILINSQGNQIYRIDINLDKDYQYCWRVLKGDDILNQLIKETEK